MSHRGTSPLASNVRLLQFNGVGCKDQRVVYLQAQPMGAAGALFTRLAEALDTLPWLAWDEPNEPMQRVSSGDALHATVASHIGSIPFYTLLGYIEERFAEEAKEEDSKKPTRDFAAEKLARKAAEMPDVDPDIDLAALRAKAQGAKMSDEEKKARGLLYDTSKASAIREDSSDEDDEGACDLGGDPFEGL